MAPAVTIFCLRKEHLQGSGMLLCFYQLRLIYASAHARRQTLPIPTHVFLTETDYLVKILEKKVETNGFACCPSPSLIFLNSELF